MLTHIIDKISQSKGSKIKEWTQAESYTDPAEEDYR